MNLSFLVALKGLGGHGSMREPLEMATAPHMQNIVEIRKNNTYFVTKLFWGFFEKVLLGLSALRAPHGGAM